VTVPLHLIGEPIGVKEKQGVLEQIIREIDVRCEPREIPDSIDVDVLKSRRARHASRFGHQGQRR
jgi:large subunit ribosomal protein L25